MTRRSCDNCPCVFLRLSGRPQVLDANGGSIRFPTRKAFVLFVYLARAGETGAARDEHAPELLVKARTDAATTRGLDEAIDRLQAFAEAGADVVFADALTSEPDIRRVAGAVDGAALSVNMGFGVRSRPTTPLIPAPELEAMGVDVVIYPRLITAAAVAGMQRALDELWTAVGTAEGHEAPDTVVSWVEYTDLVGKPAVDALEDRFATDGE